MSWGFVYVLSNPTMPGLCKIGFTSRHPVVRMNELSAATACAAPFEMLAYFDCDEPATVERVIHSRLAKYRINPAREFFKLDPDALGDVIRDYANPDDIWFFDGLDHLCTITEYIEEPA